MPLVTTFLRTGTESNRKAGQHHNINDESPRLERNGYQLDSHLVSDGTFLHAPSYTSLHLCDGRVAPRVLRVVVALAQVCSHRPGEI